MDQMMGDIAAMGGELFVMDDGWFGDKYPRKNDSYALGDWTVDTVSYTHLRYLLANNQPLFH